MSIRLRLTLLYSAILALALIVFSAALYVTQSRITLDIAKTTLAQQAEGFVRRPHRPPEPWNEPPPGEYLPGRWIQLRSADGTVIARTADLADTTLPLSADGLRAVQIGTSWFETAVVDNEPLLIYSLPVRMPEGVNGIVQVAAPIGERGQSLNTLRLVLILGSSLIIVGAFVISWVVAGTALEPIHRITQTAQAIGAEHNFSRRVQHAGPNDEVGQLATTFNTMLTELEFAYRQLEAALESQHRFVADASHELRTPLTTVRGNIELLRREPPLAAEERADVLADTKDEVERLIRLVQQLLVLARVDAGQPLPRAPLALKPLLEDVCRQSKLIAPHRSIVCEPAPEVAVLGNRDALKQVLLILLDNAVIHTPPQAAITLTTASANAYLEIRVRDTGAGIAPDLLPHLFERFYRGDVSRSGRGSGLGLAIARELVKAQEGTLTVRSKVGEGSEFIVILPEARSA